MLQKLNTKPLLGLKSYSYAPLTHISGKQIVCLFGLVASFKTNI